jgi:hypothetical protein
MTILVDHFIKPIDVKIKTSSAELKRVLFDCENRAFNPNQTLVYSVRDNLLSFRVASIYPETARILTNETRVQFSTTSGSASSTAGASAAGTAGCITING